MIVSLFIYILLLYHYAPVESHNALYSPTPWSPTPVMVHPCGGGYPLSVAQATWPSLTNQTIVWRVIGDGFGKIHAKIDPNGGTNFSILAAEWSEPPVLGLNNYTFLVPNLTCAGSNGLCSIQIASEDGWASCTSVFICQGCVPAPPPRPICERAPRLNYCKYDDRRDILVGAGFNAKQIDQMINRTVTDYLPVIFSNGNNISCQQAYRHYLCATILPTCGMDTQKVCASQCLNFIDLCVIEPSHAELYNCSLLPECIPSPTTNPKKSNTKFIIIISISCAAGIAVVLFIVYLVKFLIPAHTQRNAYTSIQ